MFTFEPNPPPTGIFGVWCASHRYNSRRMGLISTPKMLRWVHLAFEQGALCLVRVDGCGTGILGFREHAGGGQKVR